MEVLAKRMKWLREQQRLTQKEVAAEIGMSLNGYQKLESGERKPKLESLVNLAQIYEVSTDFLLGLNNDTRELLELRETIYYYEARKELLEEEGQKIVRQLYEMKDQRTLMPSGATDSIMAIESVISELENRRRITDEKLHETMAVYFKQFNDYIKLLIDLPCFDIKNDIVIQSEAPLEIDIQHTLFGDISLILKSHNGTSLCRLGESKNEEEIKELKSIYENIFIEVIK